MRVAVFGAGYAGVTAVRLLERRLPEEGPDGEDVEILLVDEDDEHLVQHELHRVIRRPSLADDITVDLADLVDRAEVRQARVTDLDAEAGEATLETDEGEEHLSFDAGVVALGAETAFYGIEGVREHARPLKRLEHARAIREDVMPLVEAAPPLPEEDEGGDDADEGAVRIEIDDPDDPDDPAGEDDPASGDDSASESSDEVERPRIVVGGAGLSGIQVAGELAALAREEGADVEVLLLEQEDEVAPTFPANFRAAVHDQLEQRGVTVMTGRTVERATADAVETDEGPVAYDAFVWTGGIAGGDAVGGDRPVVNRTLRLGPRTFGAGDAVRAVDADGKAAAEAAQTAVRQAPVAAGNVVRLVEYDLGLREGAFEPRLESYRYDSPGWVVSVGDGAVAQVGPSVFTGRTAKAMKTTVGAGYLTSVGAVRKAVDLVNEELGFGDAVESEPDVPEVPDLDDVTVVDESDDPADDEGEA